MTDKIKTRYKSNEHTNMSRPLNKWLWIGKMLGQNTHTLRAEEAEETGVFICG
jgi:hypothetical protein